MYLKYTVCLLTHSTNQPTNHASPLFRVLQSRLLYYSVSSILCLAQLPGLTPIPCVFVNRSVPTVSLKLVRLMEEQGKEWQPAARLRDIASVSELKRDIVKVGACSVNAVVFFARAYYNSTYRINRDPEYPANMP